jgi:hypothetical protein
LRGRGLGQGSLLLWRGCRRRRRLGWLALGDGGPAGIDDLHPAALVGERILLVLSCSSPKPITESRPSSTL